MYQLLGTFHEGTYVVIHSDGLRCLVERRRGGSLLDTNESGSDAALGGQSGSGSTSPPGVSPAMGTVASA